MDDVVESMMTYKHTNLITPLTRLRFKVVRWPHSKIGYQEWLIKSKYLTEVHHALDCYIAFFMEQTMPTVLPDERYYPCPVEQLPVWIFTTGTLSRFENSWKEMVGQTSAFLSLADDADHPLINLKEKMSELESAWPTLNKKANRGMVSLLNKEDFPCLEKIWENFTLTCEVLRQEDTLTALSRFSLFHPGLNL